MVRKVYGLVGEDEVAFEWSCGHIALLLLIHSAFEQSSYQIPYTIARLSRSPSNIILARRLQPPHPFHSPNG